MVDQAGAYEKDTCIDSQLYQVGSYLHLLQV